jgi:Tol biopolymer transport system component
MENEMITAPRIVTCLVSLVLLLACDTQPDQPVVGLQAQRFANSEWSVPVRLDAPVNDPTANEQAPALSSDGHALYFCSNRPPSVGNDLWVSRRTGESDQWGTPVNLGPGVNSAGGDCGPSLSKDGLRLFFTSNRAGGAGNNDIYMTLRSDPTDDLSWGTPVRLGPDVNTPAFEFSPFITKEGDDGTAELYFERGPSNGQTDIFVATIDPQGIALGPAAAVVELNSSEADGRPTLRFDKREMLLHSNRDGRGGNFDLFVSTRQSPAHPWSTPVPVIDLNVSPMHEIHPYLSKDGRTVVFVRGTGVANDIWMSTRAPSGH